jgi:hypothetical protein
MDKDKILKFLEKVSVQSFVNVQAFAAEKDYVEEIAIKQRVQIKIEENREMFKEANQLIKELNEEKQA